MSDVLLQAIQCQKFHKKKGKTICDCFSWVDCFISHMTELSVFDGELFLLIERAYILLESNLNLAIESQNLKLIEKSYFLKIQIN